MKDRPWPPGTSRTTCWGGAFSFVEGVGGIVGSIAVTSTGIGAPAGIPALVASAAVATGGLANISAGVANIQVALSEGGGSAKTAEDAGRRSRRPSTETRQQADKAATGPDGKTRCQYCKQEVTDGPGSPSSKEYDHEMPYSRGGGSGADNIKVSCRTCNRSKGAKTPDEWAAEKPR